MKKLYLTIILIGILKFAQSQTAPLWSSDYTAEFQNYYTSFPQLETSNDTITVWGRKNTPTGQKLMMIKYDLAGDTISTLAFGSDSTLLNSIIDYKFDSSNHLYILNKEMLGYYKSKIIFQKYSLDGTLNWVQQIEDVADTSFDPQSFGLINDTCLFLTSYKEYDYPAPGDDVIFTTSLAYIYAFNSSGNQLWQREFDRSTEINYFFNKIFIHDNTAFLFCSNYSSYRCLVKIDLNNNIIVNNNTGIISGATNIQLTVDSNLLISGSVQYRLTKVNLNGNIIWTRDYGTNLPSNVSGDEIRSTIQDANGNIYITGRHYGMNYGTPAYTNADILTMKCSSVGNPIWQNRYEYLIDNADIGNTIKLKNGNIYVGGESERTGAPGDYDYVVLKIDSATGVQNGVYRFNNVNSGDDAVTSLSIFDNGDVALTGLSFNGSSYDLTTQLISDNILNVQDINNEINYSVYPNPADHENLLKVTGEKFKEYSIYSILGKEILSGSFNNNSDQSINISSLKSGLHLLYLKSDAKVVCAKVVVK